MPPNNDVLMPCHVCGVCPSAPLDEGQSIWVIECKNHKNDILVRAFGNGPDEVQENWNTRAAPTPSAEAVRVAVEALCVAKKAVTSNNEQLFQIYNEALSALRALPGDKTEIFRPEDFGAVGDGVTDDTAAFQACVDAADQPDEDAAKENVERLANSCWQHLNSVATDPGWAKSETKGKEIIADYIRAALQQRVREG